MQQINFRNEKKVKKSLAIKVL